MYWAIVHSTLALRLDLSGEPTFSQALQRARQATAAAFAHGAAPFSKVVEAVKTVRSAAFTPIYQVFLSKKKAVLQLVNILLLPYLVCKATRCCWLPATS